MSSARIVYVPRPDATPETEAVALAAVYRFLLDQHAKEKGDVRRAADDAERRSNETGASSILRQQ